ncbi:unnamed protein product [Blepharisma stoltei]|uniref:Methenyltetrahydrofolate cyclohydrolase n=1 Tax=Blepharisma stoltei TaxID=1481888 RepID=A0AAU9IKJ2_9CILI|nr:unnamed protein product [Blepharisma stoltei]
MMIEDEVPNERVTMDGVQIAKNITEGLKTEIERLQNRFSTTSKPKLLCINVGNRIESRTYTSNKQKACEKIGGLLEIINFEETATYEQIAQTIEQANKDDSVNGILVQLPLPKSLNECSILDLISEEKDVDGLTSINIGRLTTKGRSTTFYPCAPLAAVLLLKNYGIEISGKHAVVIGRSNLVGIPLLMMLQKENATVTLCHTYTHNLREFTRNADIIAVAVGKPGFLKEDMVKEGCTVIDFGINVVPDNSEKGFHLTGDVDYNSVSQTANYISPVPGGVGPMTVAILLSNLVLSWKQTLRL